MAIVILIVAIGAYDIHRMWKFGLRKEIVVWAVIAALAVALLIFNKLNPYGPSVLDYMNQIYFWMRGGTQ